MLPHAGKTKNITLRNKFVTGREREHRMKWSRKRRKIDLTESILKQET
jgi:hypothetical protein